MKLYKVKAHTHHYFQHGLDIQDFKEATVNINHVIADYEFYENK